MGTEDERARPQNTLAPRLERNVRGLMARRAREDETAPLPERIAATVARFLGSLWSVAVHAVVFGGWIVVNLGVLPLLPPWDPTLVVLAMIASVEAIFLTTFVLINQNRLARVEDERAEMALQVALLSEEQTSRLVELASAIAARLRVPAPAPSEVQELTQEASPETILDEIRRHKPAPM